MRKVFLSTILVCCIMSLIAIVGLANPASAETLTLIVPVRVTAEVNNADAPKTIDDNPNEFTALTTYWQAALDPEACITFGLGQVIQVVGFRETSGPFPGNPFTAFVSTDGVNFAQIASGTLTQFAFGEHFFTPMDVQFFKLCVQRTDATGYGELADFRGLVPAEISVEIDIKPQACPNPLNVKSKGVLPVAILGTEDFDVTEIDPASIRLAGVAPIRSSIEDVSTPLLEKQDVCDCISEGEDGIDDLMLKFDTQEIISALGEVADGDELVLTLAGELSNGTPIEGKDCIIILSK